MYGRRINNYLCVMWIGLSEVYHVMSVKLTLKMLRKGNNKMMQVRWKV